MTSAEVETRRAFTELKPGDRIEVDHAVKVGRQQWSTTTRGTVVETQRRRHGLHHRRNPDDRVWSDVIVLSRPDGERTTVTVDEYTRIRPAAS
ncbi:MAG: hypothetical protein ACC645_28575 [Pirellulales bacterium]